MLQDFLLQSLDLKKIASLFSLFFITVGILGFLPLTSEDGFLFNIFRVDVFHNFMHIVSGLSAAIVALTPTHYSRLYFQSFGIFYALIVMVGVYMDNAAFNLLTSNTADHILHGVIAFAMIYLGFGMRQERIPKMPWTASNMGGGMST